MRSASASSSHIMAHWPGGPLCISPDWIVGEVKYFLEVHIAHQVENAVVDLKQIFAFVHWRKPHQQASMNSFRQEEIWLKEPACTATLPHRRCLSPVLTSVQE